jgi:hypothetical protein
MYSKKNRAYRARIIVQPHHIARLSQDVEIKGADGLIN